MLGAMGITGAQIEKMAAETGFLVRKSLAAPVDILYALCSQSVQGTPSFNGLAVSRQAVAKRPARNAARIS